MDYLAEIGRVFRDIQTAKLELSLLIKLAWENGVSQQEIADVLGVNRQRVQQICKRPPSDNARPLGSM